MKRKFKQGDKVKYIGRGFLGFDRNIPYAVFQRYEGQQDAYIVYNKSDHETLVYIYEIEPA